MIKKIKNLVTNKNVLCIFAFLSAFAGVVHYALRTSYVFVDTAVFNGFSLTFLSLIVLNSVLLMALYVIKSNSVRSNGKELADSKAFSVLAFIGFALTVFFVIFDTVNLAFSGIETTTPALHLLKQSLPLVASFFGIAFFALVFPRIKKGAVKKIISSLTAVGIVLSGFLYIFPVCNYKITSDPMVIDCGDSYSVVFATNAKGTGFVEYEYNGEKYLKYDESGGRIKADSKIHTVNVPKNELESNSYRVGSKRVIADLSYGGRSGKEIYSDYYDFSVPSGDEQSYLTVSDWHLRLDKAYEAAEYAGDYDGVILLGDAAPGFMFEDEVKENIVEFGGRLSGGVMPVIYARGNHETRGAVAADIPEYLGMDSFYYSTSYGDYNFIILDSGEDKDDSHPEYGGMNNYNQYRKDMIDWLDTLQRTDDKKTFAIVHSSEICIEDDLNNRAYDNLERLGVKQILSGHMHELDYFENGSIRGYIDGGIIDGGYVASKLTLKNEEYVLEAWNEKGEQLFSKSLSY